MNRVRIVAIAVAIGALGFAGCRPRSSAPTPASPEPGQGATAKTVPAMAVGPFYVGVSSLDVEANERAARLFDDLTRQMPDEPAVWANLGLSRLKLGDVPGAEVALATAAKLSPRNPAIALLQATVDEDSGQFARAIERLRGLADPSPAVLYRLAGLLDRTGQQPDLQAELAIYSQLIQRQPDNPVVAFGRARLLARMQDKPQLVEAINRLEVFRGAWGPAAIHQLETAKAAAAAGNFRAAATNLTFLQNLNLAQPAYQAGLGVLGVAAQAVGQPVRQFLVYREPRAAVAAPDDRLHFDLKPDGTAGAHPDLYAAFDLSAKSAPRRIALVNGSIRVDQQILAAAGIAAPIGRNAVCPADLNGDYLEDLVLVDRAGLKIWRQGEDGRFTASPAVGNPAFQQAAHGVWAVDFDADGDLDLLVARDGAPPQILRNNGDGSFTAVEALARFPEVRDVGWADLDGDGVDDLVALDTAGNVLVSWNDRAGVFSPPQPLSPEPAVAIATGDVFGSGQIDVLALGRDGVLHVSVFDRVKRTWSSQELGRWINAPDLKAAFASGRASLSTADLDNNGAIDVVASAGATTAIWLNAGHGRLTRLERAPGLFVTSIADVDGDGLLDLVGLTEKGAAVAYGRGSKHYHWQAIQTRTLGNNADSRINSFGIGGRIEVRAGPLLTLAPITSPRTHIGLGEQTEVGLARIVWPNGVAQVEFSPPADREVVATQRLKGSCPWVFTRVGDTFPFVKDFIWRSPLGMRINSQDTAGVDQTQDWILIPGRLLPPDRGAYEVRITADLWETHFFDYVSLRAVDHPASVSVFVDERFVPTAPPKLAVIATEPPRPLLGLRDQAGHDVSARLAAADGTYVDDFPLGRYQGIAPEHWVEFDLPADAPTDRPVVLIGTGWIYPTDSSLNVAISQGHIAPEGLRLDRYDSATGWQPVGGDLGFPAGKDKTVVIPIPRESLVGGYRRFRLRTNLEIYWDRLAWAVTIPDPKLEITAADTEVAELRYRGFADLGAPDRRKPDIPVYAKFSPSGPRWQDLEGYYTRYGDVRELLAGIDDRYVIMNAGDEMVLRFSVPPPPPKGWTRDFILVGDGWVKDGDFNTANSRTVLPLPSHAVHHYGSATVSLETDPVFLQHQDDWRRFHTRYVTPLTFERGLMAGESSPAAEAKR